MVACLVGYERATGAPTFGISDVLETEGRRPGRVVGNSEVI